VKSLQGAVENRLGQIEKGMTSQPAEAVKQLAALVRQERERNQGLLRKYAHLEARYIHLKQLVEKARKRARDIKAGKA
jgi:hypothetical protein